MLKGEPQIDVKKIEASWVCECRFFFFSAFFPSWNGLLIVFGCVLFSFFPPPTIGGLFFDDLACLDILVWLRPA